MIKQSCGASIYWQYLPFIKYIQYKMPKISPANRPTSVALYLMSLPHCLNTLGKNHNMLICVCIFAGWEKWQHSCRHHSGHQNHSSLRI